MSGIAKPERVMLKLSGEMLQIPGSETAAGIDFPQLHQIAERLYQFKKENQVDLAIVVGAGNFWRYRDSDGSGIERVQADKMGIHATMMNAVALAAALNQVGDQALALSAVDAPNLLESYDVGIAREMLAEGMTVVCAGGTGNPYFTTDSAAVLRALELDCDLLLKGTKVDGVYSADPEKEPDAERFDQLSYDQVIDMKLRVMDLTAFTLAMDNQLPILVFDFANEQSFANILSDTSLGTLIK